MINLLKAEFYKLIRSWSFWGLTLLSMIFGSILLLDSTRLGISGFRASLYNTSLLYFLPIIFAVFFVGEDFENRTLHCYVSAGHTRSAILFSKTIVYETAGIFILSMPLVFHGLLGVITGKSGIFSWGSLLPDIMVILAAILAMGMLPLISAFIFRDIGRALTIPMASYFLMIFMLNSDYAKRIATILPMGQLRLISLNELPVSKIVVLVVDILWIVVLYTGAYLSFCHSDLK